MVHDMPMLTSDHANRELMYSCYRRGVTAADDYQAVRQLPPAVGWLVERQLALGSPVLRLLRFKTVWRPRMLGILVTYPLHGTPRSSKDTTTGTQERLRPDETTGSLVLISSI